MTKRAADPRRTIAMSRAHGMRGLVGRAHGDAGFTLIELLVVVVIIGVLIAIAIPLYLNYTKSSKDTSAQADLRNAVNVLENCNNESGYPTAAFSLTAGGAPGTCTTQRVNISGGVTLNYYPKSDATSYLAVTSNSSGSSSTYFCYASVAGGSVSKKTGTKPSAYAASC